MLRLRVQQGLLDALRLLDGRLGDLLLDGELGLQAGGFVGLGLRLLAGLPELPGQVRGLRLGRVLRLLRGRKLRGHRFGLRGLPLRGLEFALHAEQVGLQRGVLARLPQDLELELHDLDLGLRHGDGRGRRGRGGGRIGPKDTNRAERRQGGHHQAVTLHLKTCSHLENTWA